MFFATFRLLILRMRDPSVWAVLERGDYGDIDRTYWAGHFDDKLELSPLSGGEIAWHNACTSGGVGGDWGVVDVVPQMSPSSLIAL